MANIAKVDREAMNSLYASEIERMTGSKVAAGESDIQAFKDHEDYTSTLASVLSDDKTAGPDPNGDFFE